MNKRSILLALLSLSIVFVSCKKDLVEEQEMASFISEVNSVVFDNDGQSQEFDVFVTGGEPWAIVQGSYAGWLTVDKEGKKVRVTADKFEGYKRSTEFTLVAKNAKKTFLVEQFGQGATLSLDGNVKNFYFKKEMETVAIKLETNTDDWTVKSLDNVPWLEWDRDVKKKTLYIAVKAFKKTDDNFRTNRKSSLYISAGNKHIKINITQTGWVQFGDPVFYPKGTLRSKILEDEAKQGHTRVLEYDKKFWPQGQAGDKLFMGVTNDGEQVSMTVYGFDDREDNQKFDGSIYLKPKGDRFDEDIFREAMENKGFKIGNLPSYNDFYGKPTAAYYKEGSNYTYIYTLYNGSDAKIYGSDRGPYIMCKLASNNLEVENGHMKNFPVRNTASMDDPNYKLEQIIAYEAEQGMEPDYDSDFTKENKVYPEVKYSTLAFKPIKESNEDGALFKVIYYFNYPGVDISDNARFLSDDPELAGSFGRRYDIYNGRNYSLELDREGYDVLKKGVGTLARAKGYEILRQDFSWITLWRGLSRTDVTQEKEFIDITAGRVEGNEKTTFDYYKTKFALRE